MHNFTRYIHPWYIHWAYTFMDKIPHATDQDQGAAASAPATPSAKHTRDCTDA